MLKNQYTIILGDARRKYNIEDMLIYIYMVYLHILSFFIRVVCVKKYIIINSISQRKGLYWICFTER